MPNKRYVTFDPISYGAEYRANHAEEIKNYRKRYLELNKETLNEARREKRKKNPEAIRRQARQLYAKNKARILEVNRQSVLRNSEKVKRYKAEWYKANRERLRKHMAALYLQHRKERLHKVAQWNIANREKRRLYEQKRKAQKLLTTVGRIDIEDIYARDAGICGICQKKVKRKEVSLDHILPLSQGGEHTAWNVRITHKLCNTRRSYFGTAQLMLPVVIASP